MAGSSEFLGDPAVPRGSLLVDYHFAYVHLYNELNLGSMGLLVFIMLRARKTLGDSIANRALQGALGASMAFVATDALFSLCYNNFLPNIPSVQMLLKTLYFFSTTGMCWQWLVYFEAIQGRTYVFNWSWRRLALIPFYVHIVLLIINWNTGILFGYPDGLTYTRGPYFGVQYLLAYPYAIYAAVDTLRRAFKDKNYLDRGRLLMLGIFPLIPGACGIIQLLWSWIPVACQGVSLEALVLYVTLADEAASRDPLTGLNNRRQVLRSVKNALDECESEGKVAWFIIVDVDYFKHINDTYGHVEGDEALRVVARAILQGAKDSGLSCAVGRYGGDEFVLLAGEDAEDDTALIKKAVVNALNRANDSGERPYRITLSMGATRLEPGDTVASLVARADEVMYAEKAVHHSRS